MPVVHDPLDRTLEARALVGQAVQERIASGLRQIGPVAQDLGQAPDRGERRARNFVAPDGAAGQVPVKAGLRFSMKARRPST